MRHVDRRSEELLYAIAGGDRMEMNEWRYEEVRKFFLGLDVQQDKLSKETSDMKNKIRNNKR